MNFDVTTQNWQEVENLTDDKTYFLQAKTISNAVFTVFYGNTNILFVQAATKPEDNKTGLLGNEFKFTKVSGVKIYIKALGTPINIDVQEVQ